MEIDIKNLSDESLEKEFSLLTLKMRIISDQGDFLTSTKIPSILEKATQLDKEQERRKKAKENKRIKVPDSIKVWGWNKSFGKSNCGIDFEGWGIAYNPGQAFGNIYINNGGYRNCVEQAYLEPILVKDIKDGELVYNCLDAKLDYYYKENYYGFKVGDQCFCKNGMQEFKGDSVYKVVFE